MNISNIHNCYGCGVCAMTCAKKIIDIRLNNEGFYEPIITDISKCTDCGLCREVCSYCHDELASPPSFVEGYGSWSNEDGVRRKSSSGGTGYEIGRYLIKEGYDIVGVRYDVQKNIAEHYIAHTQEELIQSMGSKYIPSYTLDAFKQIDRKKKYLVTGTPCQIDSFRRYIKKFRCEDNFVLLDFFCHGVPSMLMWKKYSDWAEQKVGKLTYVSWRNKFTGWHDSWAMSIDGEKYGKPVNWHESYNLLINRKKGFINSRLSQGDMFYHLFLSDYCLGKQCYSKCKFKHTKSSADIRIGDMWGDRYKQNELGVTGLLVLTDKGRHIMEELNGACTFESQDIPWVVQGQMATPPQINWTLRKWMFEGLRSKMPMDKFYNLFFTLIRINRRLKRIFS